MRFDETQHLFLGNWRSTLIISISIPLAGGAGYNL
jgi:multidrug efflux pump subunit AcrB